jgi:oxygen-dependent protoporphyrinogen oxidase
VVIGGGISGLAAAHRLRKIAPRAEVVLLEASNRLGGVLETVEKDGFLIESAADGFLVDPPHVVDLCQALGLGGELVPTLPHFRRALVVTRKKLRPIPSGFHLLAPSRFWPMLSTQILSLRGKLRMAGEIFVRRCRNLDDESLAQFVRRRLGQEVLDRLVQPLIGGIYATDPDRLSADATVPRYRQMERDHGSLTLALLRERLRQPRVSAAGPRYGQFATLRHGMSSLVRALSDSLPQDCAHLEAPVQRVEPLGGERWRIRVGGADSRTLEADALILATPAEQAAVLLRETDPRLTQSLREIESASCTVVALGYHRAQIGHPLDGFGFVVPLIENRTILSCSFASIKYAGRAPAESVLFRVFMGGACQSGLMRFPREDLAWLAQHELQDLLRINGKPIFTHVVRHQRVMPQYAVGHAGRVAAVERRLEWYPTLAVAGNALQGVGVPNCIRSGQMAAQRIADRLAVAGPAV